MAQLLSVEKALALVLEATPVLPAEPVPLDEACGRRLREDIRADRDAPEFDKSLMDGYAVRSADVRAVPRTLKVLEEIPAGRDPSSLEPVTPGSASRIMTGAPVPPGADAVVMVEETETAAGDPSQVIVRNTVPAGANRARRGADVRAGTVLLPDGAWIGPAEIGVLAACGRTTIAAGPRPRVAVLATGDELVEAHETPGPGRIRNSNGPLLQALAGRAGAVTRSLGIARDDDADLRRYVDDGLRDDVLLVSGGVSMGTRDLVAPALRTAGVEILFDGVAIKPGKPFTFGRRGRTLVFACPGNPVSTYVIFQVFVRPTLRRMSGAHADLPVARGRLQAPLRQRPGRAGYFQARAAWTRDDAGSASLSVEILLTSGSADYASCARGNALAVIPADVADLPAGAIVDVLLLDDHAERFR